jgi:FO synthase
LEKRLPLTLSSRSDIQTREMQQALKDCLDGRNLSRPEALALSGAEGDEFDALLATSVELRDRSKGKIVTFSPKIFVPLTNLCRDFCGYCTFR